MKPPSTAWREEIPPDEADRFQRYADELAALQKKRQEKQGPMRALHRKQVLGLRGQLDVLGDLPEAFRQGLFAKAGKYDVQLRLSNASLALAADRKPDIRGLGIKVLGVDGESALGNGRTKEQHFVLINLPTFAGGKAAPFAELMIALAKGPVSLLSHLFSTYGFFGAFRQIKVLQTNIGTPFSGYATQAFYSAAPIACGPYAVRVRMLPASDAPVADARNDWGADLRTRLEKEALVFPIQLQAYVDESITPIEDASVDWHESESPYVTVAHLTLPPQRFDDEAGKAFSEQVERGIFDPWAALAAHRPLGNVMRARKSAYFASQTARNAQR
jgi:hypothetical protein